MNIVTKADGSLLKVGTSLATSTACCCSNCTTPPTCGCMPSTLSLAIPAWTWQALGSPSQPLLSCPAQTVIAYKCCFTYLSRFYIAYRTSLINVGTFNYNGCSESVYFALAFLHGTKTFAEVDPDWCKVEIYYGLIARKIISPCTFCPTIPLVISSITACDKITHLNQCSFTNTFMEDRGGSFWDSVINCSCPLTGITTAYQIPEVYQYQLKSGNCNTLSSVPITLQNLNVPPTTFTITIT